MLLISGIDPLATTTRNETVGVLDIQLGEQNFICCWCDCPLNDLSVSVSKLNLRSGNGNLWKFFGRFCWYNINNSKSSKWFLKKEERTRQISHLFAKERIYLPWYQNCPNIKTPVPTNYDQLVDDMRQTLNQSYDNVNINDWSKKT